eukprot:7324294-Alexandrium_andersonii.AAC.1
MCIRDRFCQIQGSPSDPKTLLGALAALGTGDALPLARGVVSVSEADWVSAVRELKVSTGDEPEALRPVN